MFYKVEKRKVEKDCLIIYEFYENNHLTGEITGMLTPSSFYIANFKSFSKGYGKIMTEYLLKNTKKCKLEGYSTTNAMGFWKKMNAIFHQDTLHFEIYKND